MSQDLRTLLILLSASMHSFCSSFSFFFNIGLPPEWYMCSLLTPFYTPSPIPHRTSRARWVAWACQGAPRDHSSSSSPVSFLTLPMRSTVSAPLSLFVFSEVCSTEYPWVPLMLSVSSSFLTSFNLLTQINLSSVLCAQLEVSAPLCSLTQSVFFSAVHSTIGECP